MTTSEYDELVRHARAFTPIGAEHDGHYTVEVLHKMADAITRLTRDLGTLNEYIRSGKARAQGAEEMRSSAIAAILSIPVSSDDAPITKALAQIVQNALSCAVKAVESLPLSSPVAVQTVPNDAAESTAESTDASKASK